jgi:hypothetical protein
VANLPFANQVADGTRDFFDRYARIDAMLVEEVDVVRPEPA